MKGQIAAHATRAKGVIRDHGLCHLCGAPVYRIFELGCWMCGFEDFATRMALDEEWIHRFF